MKSSCALGRVKAVLLFAFFGFTDHTPASAQDSAYRFDVVYTGDVLSNVTGGVQEDTRYLDNLDLVLEVDAEQALGWDNTTFMVYGLYNNGNRFSEDVVGDAHVVSNIETGVRAFRLYEFWVDHRFADDRASLRFGLYDLNSEFDAMETSGLFLNSAHGIGSDFGQTGEHGPSIFPLTSLALRGEYDFGNNWLVRAAVLDGVPGDPDHPKRTTIKLGDGDGALLVGEINYQLPATRMALGAWRYTARFEDLVSGEQRNGNAGFYAFIDGRVYSESADPEQGLNLFLRAGQANDDFNVFQSYIGAGGVYRGLFPSRPEDELGLALAMANSGSAYRSLEPANSHELSIELTYRAQVHPNIALQPEVQYVINPGLRPDLDNALVVGLRFELSWGTEG